MEGIEAHCGEVKKEAKDEIKKEDEAEEEEAEDKEGSESEEGGKSPKRSHAGSVETVDRDGDAAMPPSSGASAPEASAPSAEPAAAAAAPAEDNTEDAAMAAEAGPGN